MSGYAEERDCPRCASENSFYVSIDGEDSRGICVECGLVAKTVFTLAPIEDINLERSGYDLELIDELKPAVGGWSDELQVTGIQEKTQR